MSFPTNCNNFLYEILHSSPQIWHVLAHFGKIISMGSYNIMKWWRNFVCQSVNQPMYTLMFKQRGLQLRKLVQRYRRGFLRRPRSDFCKNSSRFFRMFLKIFSWILVQRSFICFTFFRILAWYSRSPAPKFSVEILKR